MSQTKWMVPINIHVGHMLSKWRIQDFYFGGAGDGQLKNPIIILLFGDEKKGIEFCIFWVARAYFYGAESLFQAFFQVDCRENLILGPVLLWEVLVKSRKALGIIG